MGRILGSGWWSRPPKPPAPTNAGRDVTGRLLQALQWALHGAGDAGERDAGSCAAVTLAAAHYERAMSGATVAAAEPTAAAIRKILATAGRQVVTRGEAAYLVHAGEGLALEPVTVTDGAGTWDAPTWTVRRTKPSGDWTEVRVGADRLLYVIWCPDPDAGGLVGRPPWESHAARAAANLEGQLGDVGSLPVGHRLMLSDPGGSWDDEALIELYEGLMEAYGPDNRTGFAPFLLQGFGAETKSFLDTYRGEFDPGSAPLHEATTAAVASSCGIPPVLLSRTVAGAGYRDAWRSFVTTSVQSACDVLARAVVDQLGVDCEIEARARHNTPADLVSRARAAKSLNDAGADTDRALQLAGLDT